MGIITEDEIVIKKISEIRPYVRNPRENAKTIELLCKLIPKVGFNVPIVIDEKGIIVKGHARYGAAIRLGMTEVPCIVSHADAEAIKVDRITDNKIAEHSKWMNEEVESELENLDFDFDFSELGFSKADLESVNTPEMAQEAANLPQNASEGENGTTGGVEAQKPVERYFKCVCKDCGHVMFVKASELKGKK